MATASARDSRILSARLSFPRLNSRVSIFKMKSDISLLDGITYVNIMYSIAEALLVSAKVYGESE